MILAIEITIMALTIGLFGGWLQSGFQAHRASWWS
jgi:hypothetical protein